MRYLYFRYVCALSLLFIPELCPAVLQDTLSTDSTKIVRELFTAKLQNTILFLYEDKGDADSNRINTGAILGTAFLIGAPIPDDTSNIVPLIVTARHVIAGRQTVLGRYSTKSLGAPIVVRYDLDSLRNQGDLWEHPDPGVDIVVFRTLSYEDLTVTPIPHKLLASKPIIDSVGIGAGDRVIIPCLMEQFPGISKNYPIVRDGSIALITGEPIDFTWKLGKAEIKTSQKVIFINSIVNEGFSGAPVFIWPGPRLGPNGIEFNVQPWLIGVVHGFFPLHRAIIDADGESLSIEKKKPGFFGLQNTIKVPIYSQENSANGILFPAWRLLEIIESKPVLKRIIEVTSKH